MKYILLILSICLLISCDEEMQPKPSALLALQYPKAQYQEISLDCPYTFEINGMVNVLPARVKNKCWIDLNYPDLNGTIFITYQEVNDNITELLRDGQKLPLQHTQKADIIEGDQYLNPDRNSYGMFYEVEGDAASQAQFYLTDSTRHFLTGAIYFKTQPNFDSIYPAAEYLKKDMRHIMETLRWND